MGIIEIESLERNNDVNGGEILELNIGDTTVLIEASPDQNDIRVADNDTTVKVTLDDDYNVEDILQDDLFLTPDMPE